MKFLAKSCWRSSSGFHVIFMIFIEFPSPSITNLCARSFAAAAVAVPCRAGDAWPLPVANPAKAAISNCWPCWNWNCLPLPLLPLPVVAAAVELSQAAAAAAVEGAAAAVADRRAATAQETQPVQPAVDKQRQRISAVVAAALPRGLPHVQTGPESGQQQRRVQVGLLPPMLLVAQQLPWPRRWVNWPLRMQRMMMKHCPRSRRWKRSRQTVPTAAAAASCARSPWCSSYTCPRKSSIADIPWPSSLTTLYIVGSLWLSLVLLLIAVPQSHSQSQSQSQFPSSQSEAHWRRLYHPRLFLSSLSLALSSLFSSFCCFCFYCEWLLVLLFTSLFPFYAFRLRYCCFSLWLLFAADTQHTQPHTHTDTDTQRVAYRFRYNLCLSWSATRRLCLGLHSPFPLPLPFPFLIPKLPSQSLPTTTTTAAAL